MILTPSAEFLDFTWLEDNPPSQRNFESSTSSSEKPFRSRRSHTKSRNGCLHCKRRRIKCDEGKPTCDQCHRHDIMCHYPPERLPSSSNRTLEVSTTSSSYGHPWLSGKAYSMNLALVNTKYAELVYPQGRALPSSNLVGTLQHFESVAFATLGSPSHDILLRKHAISLSQEVPFLLHAIFAFSARHLKYVQPSNPRHAIDASYHRDRALVLFSKDRLEADSARKMDALFAGYMILCTLAFHNDLDADISTSLFTDASRSFLFAPPRSPRCGDTWLQFTAVMGQMLHNRGLRAYLPQSVWLPILSDVDDDDNSFTDNRTGVVDLPPIFVSLCGLDESSNAVNNPYHAAVRMLLPMLKIDSCIRNFSKFITFPCRQRAEFIQLYRDRDPVALVLMACWFAQMSGIDHWWCAARAKTECLAICTYLDGWGDERIQLLLEGPMRACGYVPIDADMIQTCVFGM